MEKGYELYEKVIMDVDDEIYLVKKRIQLKYNLDWAKAVDLVNFAFGYFYCNRSSNFKGFPSQCFKCGTKITNKNIGMVGISPDKQRFSVCVDCSSDKEFDKKIGNMLKQKRKTQKRWK